MFPLQSTSTTVKDFTKIFINAGSFSSYTIFYVGEISDRVQAWNSPSTCYLLKWLQEKDSIKICCLFLICWSGLIWSDLTHELILLYAGNSFESDHSLDKPSRRPVMTRIFELFHIIALNPQVILGMDKELGFVLLSI
jgi:hypothetical protein